MDEFKSFWTPDANLFFSDIVQSTNTQYVKRFKDRHTAPRGRQKKHVLVSQSRWRLSGSLWKAADTMASSYYKQRNMFELTSENQCPAQVDAGGIQC